MITSISRRQLLQWGLLSIGIGTSAIGQRVLAQKSPKSVIMPPLPPEDMQPLEDVGFNPLMVLRDFDYGVVKQENGKKIREFTITALNSPIKLNSFTDAVIWNYNGRVPGPTLRATAGDNLRIIFNNQGGHSHSMHFHGIHSPEMDGIEPIRNGEQMIYEFEAQPYGVQLYHCHVEPVTRHISKGLYGMLIIDPPQGRPQADEMVLIMGGFDLDNDEKNEMYAFNGLPDYYHHHPIPIYQHQLIRLYLLNMIEFDPVATFHIHGNMFKVYPTGHALKAIQETDVITMGTAERHILEFSYRYPGKYMFHPHQDAIAQKGCMGMFEVIPQP